SRLRDACLRPVRRGQAGDHLQRQDGYRRRRGRHGFRSDDDRLIRAAADGFFVVGFAGVGGDPVVGAGLRRRGAVRGCVFAVAVDRDGAVGGDQAAFGGVAGFVVEELEGDRAAGVRAEQAAELGGVLEAVADGAGGGVLDGFDRRARRADFDRLIRAARDGFFVVGFAGVGGDPVVGAGLRRRGAVRGCVFAVAVDRDGAVGGDQAAFGGVAGFVVEELEGDRAAGVRAEQARELGGVLEGGADGAGGGVLDGFDRRARGADFDRLIRAARDGFFVVGFAGVGGDPVVGAGLRRRGAVRGCVFAVAVDRDGAVGGDQAAFGGVAGFVVEELEGDRAAGVRAEQATELGGVLEGGADGAGGGVLDGFDRRARRADFDRLIRAARDGIFVVGFGGVAGGPVVGACLGRRG